MSFIFMYTILSLQGHICLLPGHKMCTRTRYFNACWSALARSLYNLQKSFFNSRKDQAFSFRMSPFL